MIDAGSACAPKGLKSAAPIGERVEPPANLQILDRNLRSSAHPPLSPAAALYRLGYHQAQVQQLDAALESFEGALTAADPSADASNLSDSTCWLAEPCARHPCTSGR